MWCINILWKADYESDYLASEKQLNTTIAPPFIGFSLQIDVSELQIDVYKVTVFKSQIDVFELEINVFELKFKFKDYKLTFFEKKKFIIIWHL